MTEGAEAYEPRGEGRILFVSDPSSIATALLPDPVEPEHLRRWVDMVADSGVDTFDQEVFSQGWTAYWRSDRYEYDCRTQHRRFLPMLDRGIQPVEILIDQTHHRGMKFLAGFRVNDNHAFQAKQQGVGIAGFIDSNPQLRLTEWPQGASYRSSEPLDFTHEAVRDFTYGVIEEVVNRFEVDGIEMCFRDHAYFPPNAGRERAGLMTDLIRRVRDTLARRSDAVGRPLRLGVRVFSTIGECLDLGLDVPTWIEQGLIDHLSPQDTMYTDYNLPLEDWSALTRSSDCMLYPGCLPWTSVRNRSRLDQIPLNSANWRALARSYYGAGADGLSIYNHFCAMWIAPFYPQQMQIFDELREPRRIAAGERHYVFDPVWAGFSGFGREGCSSTGMVNANRVQLDRSSENGAGTYRFRLYEDLTRARAATLLFRGFGLCENDELEVSLNGDRVPDDAIRRTRESSAPRTEWHHTRESGDRKVKCIQEQGRIDFRPDGEPAFSTRWFVIDESLVRPGVNDLSVRLVRSDPAATDPIVIDEVEIHVMPSWS